MSTWQYFLGGAMLLLSIIVYAVQIILFRNPHDTYFYLLQDLAFVPLQILLITILVNHMLGIREKRILLKKLNMLVGVFYSEVGRDLAKLCWEFDSNPALLKKLLVLDDKWDKDTFCQAIKTVRAYNFSIDAQKSDLANLQNYLHKKRDFLVSLLANPNILEHDTFTDLMWAIFHLTEELDHRDDFTKLPEADYAHLANDLGRVYHLLITEWLVYMAYLHKDYPYLFSLIMRSNPFNEKTSVIIRE